MRRATSIERSIAVTLLWAAAATLGGCGKKPHDAATPSVAERRMVTAPAATQPAPADAPVGDRDRDKKQALLDYTSMEDRYLNDTRGQWAVVARASSTFGERSGSALPTSSAANMVGAVDGKIWTNDNQDLGFDWLEVDFAKPVHATEVRVVFDGDKGIEAVSKVELQDEQGHWNTVWAGLSDAKRDARGPRTWFVRSFDKTPYLAKAVKVTIANNVQSGYKEVDAVQLVGD